MPYRRSHSGASPVSRRMNQGQSQVIAFRPENPTRSLRRPLRVERRLRGTPILQGRIQLSLGAYNRAVDMDCSGSIRRWKVPVRVLLYGTGWRTRSAVRNQRGTGPRLDRSGSGLWRKEVFDRREVYHTLGRQGTRWMTKQTRGRVCSLPDVQAKMGSASCQPLP